MGDKYKGKLWADCVDDLERAEFIECGRAWETGIIAPSVAPTVAEAFRFRHVQTSSPAPRKSESGNHADQA